MKIKLLFCCSLLFIAPIFIYAQVKIGKRPPEKSQEEKIASKPLAYDSTKTLEEQYKLENQYQFIGLQLFFPPVINAEAGPVLFSKKGSGVAKGNRTYTIIDILKGDIMAELKQKNLLNQCGHRYKDLSSPLWKEMIIHVVFVLRDNNKSDSLNNAPIYWVVSESKIVPYSNSYFNSFISVPYYEKQKQLYQGQEVIKVDDKSKWFCKEVTLRRSKDNEGQDSSYKVSCLLQNEKGAQVRLDPPTEKTKNFFTEKEYNRLNNANRNQKEQLIKEENDRNEKRKAECVNKFGQAKGELVAQNKIEIGMTTEMCKEAWGAPWDISTTSTKETWFYNWKYTLYFENKILTKIKH